MTYHICTEGRNPQDLVRSIIMTRRVNIGTDQKITNDDPDHQPELREIELQFFNGAKDPIEDSGKPLSRDNSNKDEDSTDTPMPALIRWSYNNDSDDEDPKEGDKEESPVESPDDSGEAKSPRLLRETEELSL
eukprot:14872045-Ditylum_brightwellii.AAC.1